MKTRFSVLVAILATLFVACTPKNDPKAVKSAVAEHVQHLMIQHAITANLMVDIVDSKGMIDVVDKYKIGHTLSDSIFYISKIRVALREHNADEYYYQAKDSLKKLIREGDVIVRNAKGDDRFVDMHSRRALKYCEYPLFDDGTIISTGTSDSPQVIKYELINYDGYVTVSVDKKGKFEVITFEYEEFLKRWYDFRNKTLNLW